MLRAILYGGLVVGALDLPDAVIIAFLIVTAFWRISRQFPALVEQPIASGIVYGVAVYFVMNYVVIPLSATTRGAFAWPVFINGILIHAFGVGVPSALFARMAVRR